MKSKLRKQFGQEWNNNTIFSYNFLTKNKFKSSDFKLFSIGSCFAKNLSFFLNKNGINTSFNDDFGFHYNPITIYNELYMISNGYSPRPFWHIKAENDELFIDPFRGKHSSSLLDDFLKKRKDADQKYLHSFLQSNAFLITYGLSEIWEELIDTNWVVLNRAPLAYNHNPLKFKSRFLKVHEIVFFLNQTIDLIRKSKGNDIPIFLTVSPVPLKTTSFNNDIRIANQRSKSNLIAAIAELIEEKNDPLIIYFPSYEIFNLPNNNNFREDLRHPKEEEIEKICSAFMSSYLF